MDGFCSEIFNNDTNKIELTFDGFEIKGFNDYELFILANKDSQFI